MADSAHSTATPDVHPLTGSSEPGEASPDFSPDAEMPSPFVSLGDAAADVAAKLAARRAVDSLAAQHGPDAEVIEFAKRTEALALRECALWGHLADLDDAVTRAMPPRPVRPTMQTRMQHAEATVDGARTISVTEPPDWRVEYQAIEATHAAAISEHERLEAEIGARLGLPLANKLTSRASRRLSRWGRRLAGLAPRTYAGLRAKAAVLRATVEDGQLYDQWRQVLAVSVGADAIRLIEAEAEERFLEDQARDGKLFSLIARHGPAIAESDAADEAAKAPHALWSAVALKRPAALYWRAEDRMRPQSREKAPGGLGYVLIYTEADVERMRDKHAVTVVEHRSPAPWNVDEVVIRCERVPDPVGEVRRLEIIAAWDAWQAEQAAVRASSGLDAANAIVDAMSDAAYAIEQAIWEYQPITFAGLQAKARWIASTPLPADHAKHVLRDLCAMAPPSDADDAPLLAAVAEFCRIDDLQDHLCRTYHADTDDIPGYAETEAPWLAWLDQIADRPALTWDGIVAKAATMKRHTVHHDQHKSDMIGESMAEDILRLAGQAWDERSNRVPSAVWNTLVEKAA